MFGTGLPEFVIILLVVLLLFGPAMLTFWLGYLMGRTRLTRDEGSGVEERPVSEDEAKESGHE